MVTRNRDLIKRMNYFDRQFLRAQDFVDEQDYHLDRRRRHNKFFHSIGVADMPEGLKVVQKPGTIDRVIVQPGWALDSEGREIILLEERDLTLIPPETNSVEIYISYPEPEMLSDESQDPGSTGYTRVHEQAVLTRIPGDADAQPEKSLRLAMVEFDGSGNITDVKDRRISAGIATNNILDDAITSAKIRDGAVESRHLAIADAGTDQDPTTGTGVKTDHLKDGSVSNIKIADNTINLGKFDTETLQKFGVEGWVRLPFIPHRLVLNMPDESNEFIREIGQSRSDIDGASGVMPIPVPAGSSRVTRFRIAGFEIQSAPAGALTVGLFRLSVGQDSTPGEAMILIENIGPSAGIFDEIFLLDEEVGVIDEINDTLSLGVVASSISRINFIAVQFE